MRNEVRFLCLLLTSISGCSQHQTAAPVVQNRGEHVMAWPNEWAGLVGQVVVLEGTAADAQLGALLQGKENAIWIAGLDAWPMGFYSGGDQGKRLRVTGTVIRKDDMPVFVQRAGEPSRAGMPVHSEEEREKAKWRYLLKDARWSLLE